MFYKKKGGDSKGFLKTPVSNLEADLVTKTFKNVKQLSVFISKVN